jgi:hypothetical protein
MEAAARVALAPTVAHSSIYPTAGKDGTTDLLGVGDHVLALEIADGLGSLVGMPIVRVDTIHPTRVEFNDVDSYGPSTDELEFDDVGYFLKPGTRQFDGFAGHEDYRQALQLTIRIRYLYQLRIPFADWIIQTCWFASRAPLSVYGQIGQESLRPESIVEGGDEEVTAGVEAASAKVIDPPGGHPVMSKADFLALYALRRTGVILFPLTASYTMRMQSNFYRKFLP